MEGATQPAVAEVADRCFHLVNLSLPKTGSASLTRTFSGFRAVHELAHIASVDAVLDRLAGRRSVDELDRYLIERDAAARPEVDSATFLHLAADRVVALFPDARFVIVLRSGERWCASFLGMMLESLGLGGGGREALPPAWVRRYAQHVSPTMANVDLDSRLSILAAAPSLVTEFAAYWGERTAATLAIAPPERTLVLDLDSLTAANDALSALTGVPATRLVDDIWSNRGAASAEARRLLAGGDSARAFDPWYDHLEQMLAESGHRIWTADGPTSELRRGGHD